MTSCRTHVLRPTWHFVTPQDIRWMLELTGPRISKAMTPYNRHLELDRRIFSRCESVLERILRDGHALTRKEIAAAFHRARIPNLKTQRLAHVMMEAELDRVVCSGPRAGREFTYALLDERAPPAPRRDRDEVLGIDGQLVGGWRRRIGRDGVHVDATFMCPVRPEERRLIMNSVRLLERHLGVPTALIA